jgi:hypothetical protein
MNKKCGILACILISSAGFASDPEDYSLDNIHPSLTRQNSLSGGEMDEVFADVLGIRLPASALQNQSADIGTIMAIESARINGANSVAVVRQMSEEDLKVTTYTESLQTVEQPNGLIVMKLVRVVVNAFVKKP